MLLIESIYTSRIYYRNLRKSDVQYYGIIYRVTFRSTFYFHIPTYESFQQQAKTVFRCPTNCFSSKSSRTKRNRGNCTLNFILVQGITRPTVKMKLYMQRTIACY